MAVLQIQANFAGEGVNPRLVRVNSNDAIATVLAAGYLDEVINTQGISILSTDFVFCSCSDGNIICTPTITAGSVDLVQIAP